jgi:aminoglycoside phosphotransferase (APT) family kinase protein
MIDGVLADDLLGELRRRLEVDALDYAEPPAKLGGGFFTDNYSFQLASAVAPWNGRLVLRLFPASVSAELAGREAATQTMLASNGFPAPAVLLFEPGARLDGRQYFVMEMLPGRPMMGGAGVRDIVATGWMLVTRLATTTASIHADLHRIDPAPLVAELGDDLIGVPRWFRQLDEQIADGATGFATARQWLVANQPPAPARLAVCHGDSWGGNILVDRGRVTGLIDWTVVTVADPLLDVGFTTMSLGLAPIDAPRPIQRATARFGRRIAARYVRAYAKARDLPGVDADTVRYYETLRCAAELSVVAAYRLAEASGAPHDIPRPTWDAIAPDMVEYFRSRTGVTIDVPER